MSQLPGARPDPLDPFVHDAAAYVLGALDAAEVDAFETHLIGCARCQAAADDVAAIPSLLDLVPRDLVDAMALDVAGSSVPRFGRPVAPAVEGPPPTLLVELLRTARRERRTVGRRRVLIGALAAAAVLVVAVVLSGVLGGPFGRGGGSAPPVASGAIELVPVAASAPVSASVDLVQVAWGTRIELSCRYDV
ncbi:MAG TPA: zf-HC2 domain-containing protein, partial [Actinotalea sp.]